jgi:hypothetical protein
MTTRNAKIVSEGPLSASDTQEPNHQSERTTPVTITVSTTDKRDGKALALFARHTEWQQGKTKDGRSFFAIPGSQPNLYHMVDCRECSCPDFQRNRNVCKHVRACRLWMAAFRTGAVAPKRESRAAADDLVVLTPEGAAYLAELAASPEADSSSNDSSGHHDCIVSNDTYAALEKLRADQSEHVRTLRLLGYTPDEYCESGAYAQRAEHISRLEACLAHGAVAV